MTWLSANMAYSVPLAVHTEWRFLASTPTSYRLYGPYSPKTLNVSNCSCPCSSTQPWARTGEWRQSSKQSQTGHVRRSVVSWFTTRVSLPRRKKLPVHTGQATGWDPETIWGTVEMSTCSWLRLKEWYSYTSIPSLCLNGRLHGEFYLFTLASPNKTAELHLPVMR